MTSIPSRDLPLLVAFLKREAEDFRLSDSKDYELRMLNQLETKLREFPDGLDYIMIQSISNMGLVDRSLILTPSNWSMSGTLVCLLPPSPNGILDFFVRKERTF